MCIGGNTKGPHFCNLFTLSIVLIFVIVGFAGTNGDDVAWGETQIHYKIPDGCKVIQEWGLKKFHIRYDNCNTIIHTFESESIAYDGSNCDDSNTNNSDFCNKCKETGKAILTFLAVSIACIVVATLFIFMRINDANSGSDAGCTGKRCLAFLVLGGLTACLIICFATWAGGCQDALLTYMKHTADFALVDKTTAAVSWGFALTVVASFLAGMTAMIEFCISQTTTEG